MWIFVVWRGVAWLGLACLGLGAVDADAKLWGVCIKKGLWQINNRFAYTLYFIFDIPVCML